MALTLKQDPVFQKSRYEKSRNYCAICATEIASAGSRFPTAAGNLDWGCDCNDWALCCEKCHKEKHSPDTCWNYDKDTYGS